MIQNPNNNSLQSYQSSIHPYSNHFLHWGPMTIYPLTNISSRWPVVPQPSTTCDHHRERGNQETTQDGYFPLSSCPPHASFQPNCHQIHVFPWEFQNRFHLTQPSLVTTVRRSFLEFMVLVRLWRLVLEIFVSTLPTTNITLENRPSQKETIVFQPSIFRCREDNPHALLKELPGLFLLSQIHQKIPPTFSTIILKLSDPGIHHSSIYSLPSNI